jgi:hypothetical protein
MLLLVSIFLVVAVARPSKQPSGVTPFASALKAAAHNCHGAVGDLIFWLRAPSQLSPTQELQGLASLSRCSLALHDAQTALPFVQRYVAVAQQLHGSSSVEAAVALKDLSRAFSLGLRDLDGARLAISAALSIMHENGLSADERYYTMLLQLANVRRAVAGQCRNSDCLLKEEESLLALAEATVSSFHISVSSF